MSDQDRSSRSIIRDIKRRTRRKFGSEEKIRIVLDCRSLGYLDQSIA